MKTYACLSLCVASIAPSWAKDQAEADKYYAMAGGKPKDIKQK